MKRFRKITAVVLAAVCELNKDTIKNDTLTETSSDMLSSIYFFKDGQVTESKAYMSSGSTADEICVVKCRDDATTNDVEQLFQSRVQKQSDLYATYKAEDKDEAFINAVTEFDMALRRTKGSIVKLIVAANLKEGLATNGDMAILAMS